jgi:glycosyltransferase involved in cell wall biosynthesis
MRVLFFNPVGFIGGAERVLLGTIGALRSRCPEIEIILVVGASGALIPAAEKLGIRVICLPMPSLMSQLGDSHLKGQMNLFKTLRTFLQIAQASLALLNYLKRLKQLIQRVQPDLIHSNGVKSHALLGLVGRLNCPVIWHVHDFFSTRPIMARVLKRLSRSIAGAIAPSQAVKNDAKTLIDKPIEVIHPAIDQHYFRLGSVRSKLLRIGLVGTFARWKGHDVFLQAAAQIKSEIQDVQFQIIGAPIYSTSGSQFSLEELQNRAVELGLDQVVEFVGFQSDTVSIYKNLDIVVHASTQPEPFGLVIAEAMAFGKAVIVSNAGGAAELVTNQHDAIAISPGDVQALAEALLQLIRDPQKREELGVNARRSAIKKFNRDHMVDQLLKVYQQWSGNTWTVTEQRAFKAPSKF